MDYNKLYTRPFLNKKIKQKVTRDDLINVLKDAYTNTRFSTLPYHFFKMNSRQAINKYNEGNCIGLSMYLKKKLKQKKIKSFLIPATIPYYIQHPDLLELSHVALAVPKDRNKTFIIDAAFYFNEPIEINHRVYRNKDFNIMNFSDNGTEHISAHNLVTKKRLKYNDFQQIPRHTKLCRCHNIDKPKITWDYILRQIINPDKAITSFFLKVKKDPFFLGTTFKNNRCNKGLEVNLYENNKYITINNNETPIYSGYIKDAKQKEKKIIDDIFNKYFN